MLEVQNEDAEVVNNATIYAVKILNEVKKAEKLVMLLLLREILVLILNLF